ncbi:hypothetical protein OEZ85_010506 [Tetradesmus obliquus]|uniref:Cytochrome P450 n=1 Tax=Tetradesmus obliquus TaxID=3088 RepID=A0ABY8TMH2_TETOB|nr:hypothetical protein OEZ85_010506 [Tetradesmus obliquus]
MSTCRPQQSILRSSGISSCTLPRQCLARAPTIATLRTRRAGRAARGTPDNATTSAAEDLTDGGVSLPTTTTSSSSSAGSSCPFLAGLPSPPAAGSPWYTRLQQLSHPEQWQRAALGSHSMVSVPSQLGLPAAYLLGTAELAKAVLAGEGDITLQGVQRNYGFATLVGQHSLLMVQEPRHKYLRNLIMPAFSPEAIERLTPRMVAVVSRYLDAWAAAGTPVLAAQELKALTFDFIYAVILGRDYEQQQLQHMRQLYGTWAAGLQDWPFLQLPFTRFGKAMAAREQLMELFKAAIAETRALLQQGQEVPGILASLVSAVDEEGNRLSEVELCDNLMLLILAGHDTSSVTLTNILANLHNHPAAMQQLRQEQQALLARHGSQLSTGVLREMPYAEAVIRETLRLRNVVPGLHRVAARDIELGGYAVPAGTMLYSPLHLLNKSDPRWAGDDVEAFRPERMMTAEGQKGGWQLSFGHGPRFCAGYLVAMAEMKVLLALLARGYDFECDTDTQWVQQVGQVPANHLPMTVTRRRDAAAATCV